MMTGSDGPLEIVEEKESRSGVMLVLYWDLYKVHGAESFSSDYSDTTHNTNADDDSVSCKLQGNATLEHVSIG